VNEFLAVEVSHGAAELVAVEHQLHVAKAMIVSMKKLTQLQQQTCPYVNTMASSQGGAWWVAALQNVFAPQN